MKILMATLVMAGLLLSGGLATPASADVSFGVFYSSLGSHGSWLVSANYGRVWRPAIYTAGWHPYYDGHWVYTDCGWTWVSDYAWGSIPYHYGTWAYDPALGWVWVPGYTWAPSWVVFSTGGSYIGWAPVPPTFSIGVSYVSVAPSRFVFVSQADFLSPRIRRHVIPRAQVVRIARSTRIVNNIRIENNIVVNRGPDVRQIERAVGKRISPMPIERVSRVTPSNRFSRDEIRVDRNRVKKGIRAAEPVSARTAAPEKGRAEPQRRASTSSRTSTERERMTVERKSPSSSVVREQERKTTATTADKRTLTPREKAREAERMTAEKRNPPSNAVRQPERKTTSTTVDKRTLTPREKAREVERAKAEAKKKTKKDQNQIRSELRSGDASLHVVAA